MPNWCDNDLYIYGKRRVEIADAIAGSDRVIDFEKIVPMPAALREIPKGSLTADAEVLLGWRNAEVMLDWTWVKEAGVTSVKDLKIYLVKTHPDLPELAEKMKALKAELGYADWYEWACAKWGTKWNVDGGVRDDQRTRIRLTFSTAWSPPWPIVDALSEKYPETKFSLRYYECSMGFKGWYARKGAKVLGDVHEQYRGRRGG